MAFAAIGTPDDNLDGVSVRRARFDRCFKSAATVVFGKRRNEQADLKRKR
jgi:hypothetical protein